MVVTIPAIGGPATMPQERTDPQSPTEKTAPPVSADPYDVVILGGRVIDGTGNAWFHGDVAFKGGRIARIAPGGLLNDATANERIDAKGLVVCPGFIDIQSHSREALLTGDGRVVSKVTQGVTTEIMGEGWSNAPTNDRTIAFIKTDEPDAAKRANEFTGPHGFDAWLRAMESHGSSVNLGSFVGSATVRAYVKGMDQGSPSGAELETMRRLVHEAMEDGAFGLASALIYPPDNFVGKHALIELAKVMAPVGGVYISHIRSEADHLLEAIDEAIEIGRDGGVPVEIYHLKVAGRRNWAKAGDAIARIAAAREKGLDVGADMYPYVAGSTGLAAILPPFASAGDKLFERLTDPTERAKIRAEVLDQKTEWESMGMLATPENILILGLDKPANKKHMGKRLAEIAQSQGKHWLDAAMDLILSEHKSIATVYFMMSEENVRLQLRQPWIKFGTDAEGIDPEHTNSLSHPRAYGTFPRILGKYVRDEKVMPLEEAIRKMTSAVADRLSIRDRGLLREGFQADVVIFDPDTIADRATYEKPHQLSVGIKDVFVNGTKVVHEGRHTGSKPGKIVRGPGYRGRSAGN
jgi:N-acyl-D-amino-acid deacylase